MISIDALLRVDYNFGASSEWITLYKCTFPFIVNRCKIKKLAHLTVPYSTFSSIIYYIYYVYVYMYIWMLINNHVYVRNFLIWQIHFFLFSWEVYTRLLRKIWYTLFAQLIMSLFYIFLFTVIFSLNEFIKFPYSTRGKILHYFFFHFFFFWKFVELASLHS